MNAPIDLATRETVEFLAARLAPRSRVLEVGCGEGDVALALRDLGHAVLGLDEDASSVERAKRRGAPVVHARWPVYDGAPVDAVLFTRSLHHIGRLRSAVERARQLIVPGGALLVEDFAFDRADLATIAWFHDAVRQHRGDLMERGHGLAPAMLETGDAVARWREHHAHGVHPMPAMIDAIASEFHVTEARSVPYLYRYLIPALPATARAACIVQRVLEDEAAVAASGAIALIGLRIVASPR